MAAISEPVCRVEELTDRRRRAGIKSIRVVLADLNPVLRGWGNYFRAANAADKFIQIDRHVAWRLKRLLIKRKGAIYAPGRPLDGHANGSAGWGFPS